MRIGIEAQRIFRTKKHGMDIFALQLIKNLQKIDQVNEYFIFVKKGPDAACLTETKNFKIIEVEGFTYLDWEQFSLPKAVKKAKLDMLHCTSNTAPIFVDVPKLITLHDIIYLTHKGAEKGSFYQKLGHYYRKWIVPQVAKTASQIVTVSEFEKKTITDNLTSENLSFIYNGVADHFFQPTADDQTELPSEYILFLGNLAQKKNMTNMLKGYAYYAANTATPLPLVVLETSKDELNDMLNKLGLSEIESRIVLPGYVPQSQLPVIYQKASLFVYPSLRESFGIPILEAMASGTPVITSCYSSMPEVAGGCARLVESKDHLEIGLAISQVLENESIQKDLIRRGQQRAQLFTWEEAARKYLEIYLNIGGSMQQAA